MVLSMKRHLAQAQTALKEQTDDVKTEMQKQNDETMDHLKIMTS